ncbi:MAG: hypothetical protein AAFU85_11830 [Planctomycetota bacterium]
MSDIGQTFGGRFYSELRQLSGYDVITRILDYKAIQQLKVSDRDDTLKLFRGGSQKLIQLLEAGEPEDAARCLVTTAKEAINHDTDFEAALLLMINSI